MLGIKFYKTNFNAEEYTKASDWCEPNNAMIVAKGEYYEVVEIPAPSLEELKTAKLQEVDTWTANKITGGFVSTCYNGESVLYDTDTNTQLTMSIAKNCSEGDRFAEELPNGLEVRGYEQVDVDEDGTLVFSKDKTIYYFSPEQIKTWNEDFALFLRECKKEG